MWIVALALVGSCWLAVNADFDGRWPRQMVSTNGLCRYGARMDCCWGWTRVSWGQCQPMCQHGCKHGECIGPNKCKCNPGFTGKTCNQDERVFLSPPLWHSHPPVYVPTDHRPMEDLNECGLKPRPCKHRCMNTYGSFKCYCLNGFMLLPDGSCSNARTCGMANCQYGCEVLKGEVRCQCPSPGLQLAPDRRTCVDVDECATGLAVCPRYRKCINTFGSYVCKCHDGFDLQYINGKYQCTDVDECSGSQHKCGPYATCYNTPGSYKCKCRDEQRGVAYDCKPIPKVIIDPPQPGKVGNNIPGSDQKRTTTTTRPLLTAKRITPVTTKPPPPRRATPPPRPPPTPRPSLPTRKPYVVLPSIPPRHRLPTTTKAPVISAVVPLIPTRRPFIPTRKPLIPTPRPLTPTPRPHTPTRRPIIPLVTPVDNTIKDVNEKQRGDVHIPRHPGQNNVLGIDLDIELGNTEDEPNDDPGSGGLSCSFDHGLCGWIQHTGDLHWETAADPSGGLHLMISEGGEKRDGRGAQLVIPLTPPWNEGNLCLAFRHNMAGHHVGTLQVFVQRGRKHSPAVWSRTGGHGWRSTQITLWANALQSVVLKGERRRGRRGEVAVDDLSLRRGSCQEEHSLRTL